MHSIWTINHDFIKFTYFLAFVSYEFADELKKGSATSVAFLQRPHRRPFPPGLTLRSGCAKDSLLMTDAMREEGLRDTNPKPPITAVAEAAKLLREMILEKGDGAFLGSREDLVQRLSVGHVTLQQAARLLERERLLFVRRGTNGGYFARIPDEAGVKDMVATYLRARHVSYRNIHLITTSLESEMERLAARSEDESARKDLVSISESIKTVDSNDVREVLRLHTTYLKIVCRMAANPLGELIILVTLKLFAELRPESTARAPDDAEKWRYTRLKIIQCILDHDEEAVVLYSRRWAKYVNDQLISPS
jgi:GntR family transcriptional regulator, transcriptional repressor for pyruvate dehydrogenase complex